MKNNISQEQLGIISFNDGEGALLVNASAGSGKTFVLTERVRYLLTEKPGKFKVLCLTFTNKAAEEMKQRLSDVQDINDRAFIGTLHSFALEILTSRRNEIGYDEVPHILERESDRLQILKEIIYENPELRSLVKNRESKEINELLNRGLKLISDGKKQLKNSDDPSLQNSWDSDVIYLYEKYNERLRSQNLIDYDDILFLAWKILINNPSVSSLYRKIFKYILVDEAQDLSFAQYEIIKAICGSESNNIMMVGDPNQAIHGYAGASKVYMQEYFVKDFNATVMNLMFNYRSSKAVLNIANQIMPTSSDANLPAFYDGYSQILAFEDENAEAEWIVFNIKSLIDNTGKNEERITIEDICVLARNKYVFNTLVEHLENDERLKNNFYIKKGSDSLLPESGMMKKYDLGTKLLSNPKDLVHFNQLIQLVKKDGKNELNIHHSDVDGMNTLKIIYDKNITVCDEALLNAWEKLNENINNFSSALDEIRKYANTKKDENSELILLDVESWQATWDQYIRNSAKSNRSVSDFRRYAAMSGGLKTQKNGLTLSVVHMAKGLEYHTVFLMGMNEGTFPDFRAVRDGGTALNEEQNTAYVAVTRAKRQLFISYPKNKKMPWGDFRYQEPSRFIRTLL